MENLILVIPGLRPELIESTGQLQERINKLLINEDTKALLVELSFLVIPKNADLTTDLTTVKTLQSVVDGHPTLYYSNGKKPKPKYDETGWPNLPR